MNLVFALLNEFEYSNSIVDCIEKRHCAVFTYFWSQWALFGSYCLQSSILTNSQLYKAHFGLLHSKGSSHFYYKLKAINI